MCVCCFERAVQNGLSLGPWKEERPFSPSPDAHRCPKPVVVAMPAALVASPNSSLSDLQILDDKPFVASPHFYVRQPHCLQIIQLEEADTLPPPPAHKAISSSSFASSSYYSSSYYSESEAYSEDDEEEDQEMCSSYCSSEEEFDLDEEDSENNAKSLPGSVQSPETYSLRMKRILAWREHFDAASTLLVGGALSLSSICQSTDLSSWPFTESTPSSKSLKRKLDTMCEGDEEYSVTDNVSSPFYYCFPSC